MSVNGITNNGADKAYGDYYHGSPNQDSKKVEEKVADTAENTSGVVYESSKEAAQATKTQKYKPDAEMIARLKNDANNRKAQLMDLVHRMMNGQVKAHGKNKDIWEALRTGNFKADPATISQAQADVAEDGYWGVSQTSQRILDFATALTGGDPDKIEEMREAFEKGYKMAERTWGGKLPDISRRTFDAVMAGFDKMKEDAAGAVEA